MEQNIVRNVKWQVVVVVAISILWTWMIVWPDDASAVTDACKLLTAGEIEAIVGEKVSIPAHAQLVEGESGAGSFCHIKIGNGPDEVTVSVAPALSADKAKQIQKTMNENRKKQGWKVTEESSGNSSCSTVIPPAPLRPTDPRSTAGYIMGYMTGCNVTKGGVMVGVAVSMHSEGKIVPISKLRPLSEKAASRL